LRFSYENTLVEDALFQGASMDAPLSDGTTTRLRYNGSKISDAIQDIQIDVYQSTVDHTMNNFDLRDYTTMMEVVSDVETTGAKVKLTSMIGHTKLDYGLQFESINKTATPYMGATLMAGPEMWPDVLQETKSVFAESTSFFKDQQKVILGLRYDAVTTEARNGDSTTYENVYTDYSGNVKTDDANINGLLRYERTYQDNINVFAGLSRTHRYPDATELYIAKDTMTGDWFGNPDIKPEQHNQFDLGISQATSKTNWSVSAYYDVINNYILRDSSSNQDGIIVPSSIYMNKDATIYGLDMAGSLKTSQHVKVGSSLSLTKGTNETDNRNLSNIAPLSGMAFAEYSANSWKAGTRFNFATAQTEVNAEYDEVETAAWSTLDVYGDYQINKSIKLSAGVDNLADHAYQTYLNRTDTVGETFKVYEPGRTVWARLNAKF
jgi:iron complex outermembrane receptor protein